MQGAFGTALSTLGSSPLQLVAAAPSQLGCNAYPQGTSFKGQVVLVQRGTCTFAIKVRCCPAATCSELDLPHHTPLAAWLRGG